MECIRVDWITLGIRLERKVMDWIGFDWIRLDKIGDALMYRD